MYGITVREAAAICGGSLFNMTDNTEIKRVVIDSRVSRPGDMFVAFRGDKVDGHNFISCAFDNGASCALADHVPEGVNGAVICVDDVQKALEDIASAFRDTISIPLVGITGSVGKTTAKEMVYSVLYQHFNVYKTAGNLNNNIGVPMSISEIEKENEIAVIEMGISHFLDMDRMARVAKPDVMLYTMIGHAHLEFLNDLDGVLQAKTEVLQYMKDDSVIVINGDDPMLRKIKCTQQIISYGVEENNDVRAFNVVENGGVSVDCDISYQNRLIHAHIPSFGMHMVYTALEGAAVGFLYGLSDDEIEAGIATFRNIGRRQAFTDTGSILLVDDCYNANPDSMKASIDSLLCLNGRKVCVLGDMREMGETAPQLHYEIGQYALEKGIDKIFCTGEFSVETFRGAGEIAEYFETQEELIEALKTGLKKNDAVLVKASLGSHLEPVSEFLKELKL